MSAVSSSGQGYQGGAARPSGPRVATIHTIRQNEPQQYGGQFAERQENRSCRDMCVNCLRTTPFITLVTMLLCISLWIYTTVNGGQRYVMAHYASSPALVLWDGDVRLLLSSAFFHLGVLHILFNMLATYFVMKPVERSMGSLAVIGQILSAALISGLIYCATFWSIAKIFSRPDFMFRGVAGFSGVVFFYIPLVLIVLAIPAVNFCGFFIPTAVYPWFLLLLTSLGTGVSFMGHLAGLLTSYLYIYGLLNWLSLPRSWLLAFESTKFGELLQRLPGWIPTPTEMPTPLAEKQFAFTTTPFEATAFGRCTNRVVSSCARVCCCGTCLSSSSSTGGSGSYGGSGGVTIPSHGGHVLGADSDSDLELGQGQPPARARPQTSPPPYPQSYQSDARPPASQPPRASRQSRPGARPAQAIAELAQAARGQSKPLEPTEAKSVGGNQPTELREVTVSGGSDTTSSNQLSPHGRAVDPNKTNKLGYSQLEPEGNTL